MHLYKFFLYRYQGPPNKFNSSIFFFFQFIEDERIKDKNRHNKKISFQRMIEAGIIIKAKITSKPKDVNFLHNVLPGNKQNQGCVNALIIPEFKTRSGT